MFGKSCNIISEGLKANPWRKISKLDENLRRTRKALDLIWQQFWFEIPISNLNKHQKCNHVRKLREIT
jgi:hypothetical protein